VTLTFNVIAGVRSPFHRYNAFTDFYNRNGKKAGVYTYSNNRWSYRAR
jgi:hypothetical protein